jgi:cell division septum initiation protein DivIVA
MGETDIQRIENKLQLLIQNYQRIQSDNVSLQQQLKQLETTLEKSKKQVEELDKNARVLQLSAAHSISPDDNSRKALKALVNDYLKEIDHCIALLNA